MDHIVNAHMIPSSKTYEPKARQMIVENGMCRFGSFLSVLDTCMTVGLVSLRNKISPCNLIDNIAIGIADRHARKSSITVKNIPRESKVDCAINHF